MTGISPDASGQERVSRRAGERVPGWLFLIALGACPSAWPGVAAPIRAVVLYPGTAIVQREVAVSTSTSELEVSGLPTDFTADSLRIEPDEGIHVGQVSFHDAATVQSTSPRAAALEARIQALKDQEAELDIESSAAQQVKEFLSHLGSAPSDGSKPPAPIDARSLPGILEAIRKGMTGALGTIRRVEVQKRGLDKQIEAMQRDLDALKGGGKALRTVSFPVSATRSGRIELSYPMVNAGWAPKYRAMLDSASGRVVLERQALIHQRTGEDWTGIKLRLSTGEPKANASAPDPASWFINVIEPVEFRAKTMAAAPMMEGGAMAAAPAPPPPPAEVQAAFATQFDVQTPVNLPSDGSQVTVSLGAQTLETQTRIRTVPRVEAAAYVEAEAERPEGVWLPGEVQLVRDGDYVGTLAWEPDASDIFLLSFGRDDRVRVTYLRSKTNNGNGSLIDSRRHREVVDTFTVSSSHDLPYALVVIDSSPVSTSDEIKVEKDFTPKPDTEQWKDHPGVVAWKTTLPPRAKQTFEAHYTVTYPKDKRVIGLP